jgi:hypothetical protein
MCLPPYARITRRRTDSPRSANALLAALLIGLPLAACVPQTTQLPTPAPTQAPSPTPDPVATWLQRVEEYLACELGDDYGQTYATLKLQTYDVESTSSLVSPFAGTALIETPLFVIELRASFQQGRWVPASALGPGGTDLSDRCWQSP